MVTPSRSWRRPTNLWAFFCAPLSPPLMPARISPVLPSLLINAGIAGGGAVHGELTSVTNAKCFNWSTRSEPTDVAAGPSAPASEVTQMISCMSPCLNLSDSSRDACQDSDVGSCNPPADRLLMTGIPKMAVPTITSSATAMIRRGAAMASRAIRCNKSGLPAAGSADGRADQVGRRNGQDPVDRLSRKKTLQQKNKYLQVRMKSVLFAG